MAYIFKRSMVFNATPDKIFDALLDIGSHIEWGEMSKVELLYDGPAQVGSQWRSVGKAVSQEMHDLCTITVIDRPRQFSFQVNSKGEQANVDITLSYHLELVPEGTKVTFSRVFNKIETTPFFKFLGSLPGFMPLMDRLMIAKIVDRGLAGLRKRVEAKHA